MNNFVELILNFLVVKIIVTNPAHLSLVNWSMMGLIFLDLYHRVSINLACKSDSSYRLISCNCALERPTAGVTCAGRLSCARHNSLLLRLPGLAQYGSNATLAMVLAKNSSFNKTPVNVQRARRS